MYKIIIAISFFCITGCFTTKDLPSYKTGTISIKPKKDDVFTKPSLTNYMKSTKNPTFVLRVPKQIDDILDENKYSKSQIYNTIEKELAKADFIVRDRALYQKVLDQNIVSDYSKIKELTNTDLILELVNYENINFNTNKYIDAKGRDKTIDGNFTLKGVKIEFKLIKVKENDLVGSYSFFYSPCSDGCKYTFDSNGNLYANNNRKKMTMPYEFVSSDNLEDFFKSCAKRLINELK